MKLIALALCLSPIALVSTTTTLHAEENTKLADVDQKYHEIGSITVSARDFVGETADVCVDCYTSTYSLAEWNRRQELAQEAVEALRSKFGLNNDTGNQITLGQVLAYGEKLWKIVEAGKPVSNFETPSAHALPSNSTGDWLALENWQTPRGRIYSVTYKNLYNAEVVRFDYRLIFTPGGTYLGHGKYLSQVSVQPQNVWVAWGYDLDAKTRVLNVINTATRADPVAGIELLVDWTVKTVLRDMRSSTSFFVQGDGKLVDLNGSVQ